jgi:Mlc titration factor MtfA (ptsG expression regulator)
MIGAIILLVIALGIIVYKLKALKRKPYALPATTKELLEEHVAFYSSLGEGEKTQFEKRVADFLAAVSITGVGVEVEDLDRLLIASGAIIPIFSFPDWRYNNISEVLVYGDTFSADYRTQGKERSILGMVGDGVMNRQMILSRPSVRSSFQRATDGHNTVIHEFVHLLDKADGSVDGIPEYLLSRPYVIPWLNLIRENIARMRQAGRSDINLYAATNDAEFFAVVSECFFERPGELRRKHPQLYDMLQRMFDPQIQKNSKEA